MRFMSQSSARYVYRIRPGVVAAAALGAQWDCCRWVWNQCVAESRRAHKERRDCGPAGLDKQLTTWRAENEWLRAGSSVAQQQMIREFGKARAKALKDIKNRLPQRQRRGMPRFKKRDHARVSLQYTQRGFSIRDGQLRLPAGVSVPVVWSRDLPCEPTSVRVYRDACGDWFASFVVLVDTQPLPATGQVIGVDWGVKELATTTSDAHDLPHLEHGKNAAGKLARYQQMMARRKPKRGHAASGNYRKAKTLTAREHRRIARQRLHTARVWAKQVVTEFDQLAVEDFRPRFLAKSTMARKAADAAIAATKAELAHMAAKHERTLIWVDPKHTTTMDCCNCGARTTHPLPLSQRTYQCEHCGWEGPRDKNSARVMLARAGLNPHGVDGARPGGSLTRQAA